MTRTPRAESQMADRAPRAEAAGRRPTRALLLALAASLVLALPASSQDRGFYISAKRGSTDVDAEYGDTFRQALGGDLDSDAYELGYRFGKLWGVQAGYHDLGSVPGIGSPCPQSDLTCLAELGPIRAEVEAYSAAFVLQYPIGFGLTAFGKTGLVFSDAEIRSIGDGGAEDFVGSFSEQDVIFGLGLRLNLLSRLQVFGEWESFGGDFETVSFGLTWQF